MVAKTKAAGKAAQKKAEEAEEETTGDKDADELLSASWGSVQKEQMLPDGTYRLKVRGYAYKAKTEKASASVTFFLTPMEPLLASNEGDVDDEAFEALGEDYDLSINSVTADFWLGEARDWSKVFSFIEKLGIDTDEVQDLSRKEVFDMAKKKEVNGYVKTDNYKTKTGAAAQKLIATGFSKIGDDE